MAKILEMKNITKYIFDEYGKKISGTTVKILDQVNFDLELGEVHVLMGENGAGKSTLMKILGGNIPLDEGEMLLEGQPYSVKGPKEAREKGVAFIHKELNLCLNLDIAHNIFLGREPVKHGLVDHKYIYQKSREYLDEFGFHDIDPRTMIRDLSTARQQVVEIVKALSYKSKILIMDEPTASLTASEITHLFNLIRKLKSSGVSIIYISHRMDELKEIALETKCKLHYSHAIFVGRRSFKDKAEFLQIMNGLREAGVDAMFDIYNELLGVSVITVILPAWYQAMSIEERRKPLNRLKLTVLVYATSLLLGFGFKDIQVAYIGKGFEKYEGKSVHDIAKAEGMSDLDAYLMLCEKSDYKGRVNMGPYTTPEIISDFEHNENCLYMTDAWVEEFGVQNPAIYDCFPKFLRDALTGTGDTLENTIRRMTGATADRFKLSDRGYIRPGCFADLTVFDEKEIRAAQPDQEKPFGIRQVFINGKQVLSEGTLDKEALKTTGRAIRVG